MSMARDAADLINQRGHGDVDDILQDMPGCTRAQVMRALKTALDMGLIDSDGWQSPEGQSAAPRRHRATGRLRGSKPATYRAVKKQSRPAPSVWAYAAQLAA